MPAPITGSTRRSGAARPSPRPAPTSCSSKARRARRKWRQSAATSTCRSWPTWPTAGARRSCRGSAWRSWATASPSFRPPASSPPPRRSPTCSACSRRRARATRWPATSIPSTNSAAWWASSTFGNSTSAGRRREPPMSEVQHAQAITYEDAWLVGGARTPFADYNGTFGEVSATDLGIKAARAALAATAAEPDGIDAVVAASVAQTSYDAFFLARHIGLYAGVPALLVQRLCTSGFEAILQAADQIALGKSRAVLCVGTESMTRNPIAAYGHR